MRRVGVCLLVCHASVACTESDVEPPPVESTCLPPNRLVGGRCLEPGVQDDGCPAGTLGLDDGSCQPAGVPPELCAEGFLHTGDGGCEPILPLTPCDKGQMAIPGERACHAVMACANGTWGDIPVDSATVYVNGSYAGGGSDGSSAKPWITIVDAVTAAAPGALIAVAAGTYVEDVVVTKPVRLWGVCPERVALVGTAAELGALFFRPGSDGSEVRGLAISGERVAVLVTAGTGIIIEQLWVHDALSRGVNVESTLGTASVTVRDSLIEENVGLGVYVAGSEATLEGLVVRGTLPGASNQGSGRGIVVQYLDSGPSTGLLKRSVVEGNHELGVYVGGSQATLEGVVVRGTLPQASDQDFGVGVLIESNIDTGAPATAHLKSSLVERNHMFGVYVGGSEATLEGLVVRGTLPRTIDQHFGRGIQIQLRAATGAPSTANVKSSLVEGNHDIGVLVGASQATLEGLLVRGTLPRASDQQFGMGINIQVDPVGGALASALVKGSLIEESHDSGVFVHGSEATLEGVVIRGTSPRASDSLFGDGLAVATAIVERVPFAASAVVTNSRIEHNARAGLGNFGAHVALRGNALSCNAFDLDREDFGVSSTFEDLDGNGCGCPAPTDTCVARSSGLAPPEPPVDPP